MFIRRLWRWHPFAGRDSAVVCDEFVSQTEGTGCVHTAPGHGKEDFELGRKCNLPVLSPVDGKGHFTEEAGEFAGMNVFKADEAIIEKLGAENSLVLREELSHSYPNCWRCKKPLIMRATEQWFISVSKDGFRERMLSEIENVKWLPAWGKTRIRSMMEERPDWCISRQRVWGVPIPVFRCESCGETIADEKLMRKFKEEVAAKGTDIWYEKDSGYFLNGKLTCVKCGSGNIAKGTDILDVWFDSGASSQAVLSKRKDLSFPADIYLEGTDQHRGWFQTSLIVSSAARGTAPYRTVLTHGFMVDGAGKKMSKSIGNLITANELIEKFGADVVRLWICAEDYRNDIRYSPEIIDGIAETYKRFRNTARYMLGNLYDFSPDEHAITLDDLPPLEKYVLHRLHLFTEAALTAYENFEFHRVYHLMHDFCAVDLSAFYFDIIKGRLYTLAPGNSRRRAAQTVLHRTLDVLVRILAPVLPHTCDEIWHCFNSKSGDEPTVHLSSFPEINLREKDKETAAEWSAIIEARKAANKQIENARNSGLIGNSLQARLIIHSVNDAAGKALEKHCADLPEIFIVSEVELGESEAGELKVTVERSKGEKCPRCWKYTFPAASPAGAQETCAACAQALEEIR